MDLPVTCTTNCFVGLLTTYSLDRILTPLLAKGRPDKGSDHIQADGGSDSRRVRQQTGHCIFLLGPPLMSVSEEQMSLWSNFDFYMLESTSAGNNVQVISLHVISVEFDLMGEFVLISAEICFSRTLNMCFCWLFGLN